MESCSLKTTETSARQPLLSSGPVHARLLDLGRVGHGQPTMDSSNINVSSTCRMNWIIGGGSSKMSLRETGNCPSKEKMIRRKGSLFKSHVCDINSSKFRGINDMFRLVRGPAH